MDFERPKLLMLKAICLFKLDNSILSWSHISIFPMPAAEQKIAVGLPKPPAPIIKTLLF